MGIKINEINPEQKAVERAFQATSESEFASKLADSMDLPASLADNIEEHHAKELKEPEEEEIQEDGSEEEGEGEGEEKESESEEQESSQEEPSEESKDSEESEEEKEEEDSDLIPRSKVQKRFDEQTRQIKKLQAELKQIRESQAQPVQQSDETVKKLEAMSEQELEQLRTQVRMAQIRNSSDEAQLKELVELERKIDRVEKSLPLRFQQQQISKFYDAVKDTSETVENFDKVKELIFSSAKRIFDSSPELQNSVTGQERAWRFAVEQYEILAKQNAGKSKINELERQVNTLKKKVSVESVKGKASQPSDSMEKAFKKAKFGTLSDKEAFVKRRLNTDSFVPEEFLGR